MKTGVLLKKLEQLPAPLKKQVEDYIDFLIYKKNNMLSLEEAPRYNYNENLLKFKVSEPKPVFGSGKGLFGNIADDFDAPLDEMKDYM